MKIELALCFIFQFNKDQTYVLFFQFAQLAGNPVKTL